MTFPVKYNSREVGAATELHATDPTLPTVLLILSHVCLIWLPMRRSAGAHCSADLLATSFVGGKKTFPKPGNLTLGSLNEKAITSAFYNKHNY
jgi:hypothetical protein